MASGFTHKWERLIEEQDSGGLRRVLPSDLIGLHAVLPKVGVSRATLLRMVTNGTFISPLNLGVRRLLWRRGDVDAWVASRTARPPLSSGHSI